MTSLSSSIILLFKIIYIFNCKTIKVCVNGSDNTRYTKEILLFFLSPVVLIWWMSIHIFLFLNTHTRTHTPFTLTLRTILWKLFFDLIFFYIAQYHGYLLDLCMYMCKSKILLCLHYRRIYTVLVKFRIFSNVYDYFHFLVFEFPISQRKMLTHLKKN